MGKALQVKNIFRWLTLFTYISATILIIINNTPKNLICLIPLILILFFVNYFREYYLFAHNKPVKYTVVSIILEMLLILVIGFFENISFNILYFYVLVSSTVIIYPFLYSVPLALTFLVFQITIYALRNGRLALANSLLSMLFSIIISTAFVMGMSYLVKMQIREKEKQAHINTELEEAYKKLIEQSALAQKLTIEEERTRMAREIHDTLAHTLTNLIVQLEVCKKLSSADPSRLPTELEKAQELSRSGFNDVKRSIKALRPQAMEDKTFLASISSIINETMENTKVHISLTCSLSSDIKFPSQVEIALFRAIQESITNSIRHGQPSEISISVKHDNNMVQVSIEDNGLGCSSIKKGYGMRGIRERIESLNGKVVFSSVYGRGFKTAILIPNMSI